MRRFLLLLATFVALLVLATTAALAGDGRGKSNKPHGKSAQAHAKKHGGPQGGTAGAPTKIKLHGRSDVSDGQSGRTRATGRADANGTGGKAGAPGCNGTIHLSAGATAENGTDPKYTQGEDVWAHGRGFDSPETFTWYEVEDVNDHAVVLEDHTVWTASSGSFDKWGIDTATLTDAHEYKLTVYWNETLPNGKVKECRKSKNFFIHVEETESGGGNGGGEVGGGDENEETAEEDSGNETGQPGEVSSGGVAGGNVSGGAPQSGGGVLGAVTNNLPFTGMPIWFVALIGAGVLAAGLATRRFARSTS